MKTPLALIFMLSSLLCYSQTVKRFEKEIQRFEQEDAAKGYQKDFVLFTGSSSIRMWDSLATDMSNIKVLNRGFGGATLPELIDFWERISGNHQPDLVVVYCGENDIADGATPDQAAQSFKKFLKKYKKSFPNTPMIYIAMKPSLSRWSLWQDYQKADSMIQSMIDKTDLVSFIDLSPSMLKADGTPKKHIFIEDGLHMNAEGYKGWTELLKPVIINTIARHKPRFR